MLDKKVKRFFIFSVISVLIVCGVVFVSVTLFMSGQTEASVEEINNFYMSEMSRQIQQKFDSVTSLRLDQVDGIMRRCGMQSHQYADEMFEVMKESAEIRNFDYFGLYSQKGEEKRLLGEPLQIAYYDSMLEKLGENGDAIGVATDSRGEKMLMLAKQTDCLMENGSRISVMIAGVTMDYLGKALFLDEKDAMVYSHVIDRNGTFVVRSNNAYRNSYFERIRALAVDSDGMTVEDYIAEMKENMDIEQDYSAVLLTQDGSRNHLYCSLISDDVDWFLISVMPGGTLDARLHTLDRTRILTMVISSSSILLAMLVIFIMYYRLSRQQMREMDRKEQEAVRANRAKSEFLSSMSHDIRTPMNAIIGMTEIALKNLRDPVRIEDCLKKVRLSSRHLLGLINDVLDMSKIESGKMTLNISQTSLREVMDDIVNIMQPQVKEHNQYFDIFIQDIRAEEVECDAVRLNQVLLNLISNAVKFTPEGGRINVRLYQDSSPLGEEYVRTHFWVEDTGIGMSKEFQQKIFDTFAREESREKVQKTLGTGLGTSISKNIVNLMGGTIELESEEGKGSKFHVTLDLKQADMSEDQMRLPAWNVLVVDDNEALCLSAAASLEALGVHTEWVQSGRAALDLIEERHNRGDDYQFVLIDWKMPEMDGPQTVREIHQRVGGAVRVFLISAYDWSELEGQKPQEGVEGFISKPLFRSSLYNSLKQYAQDDPDQEETGEEQIDLSGKNVLLAEDIEINWEIAKEILSATGLKLEWAENGRECVDKFIQSQPGFYDAVLMDIRMPVMDGYTATREIRALERSDSSLPIIAMTADAFADDAQRCYESGMNAHLTKPLDIRECMRTLQKFLKI